MSTEVLIIDDSADLRALVARFLNGQGFGTAEACNGQAALEYLASHDAPDVILLDCEMGVMSGPAFLDALEKINSSMTLEVPVIGLSGHRGFSHKALAQSLRKPVDFDELELAILTAVARTEQKNLRH